MIVWNIRRAQPFTSSINIVGSDYTSDVHIKIANIPMFLSRSLGAIIRTACLNINSGKKKINNEITSIPHNEIKVYN